jgi:hypothetical protein
LDLGDDEIMKREIGSELMAECFEKISEIAGEEYIPHNMESTEEDKHIMQGGPARFVLKKLLKVDRNQPNVKLSEYMAKLPKEMLVLFSATNSGCFDLQHMMLSGSEEARSAVINAVNVSSLKKKTGFPGRNL